MKLPNGYGSVVKLKGKRRNPWAVRISYLEEQPDGIVKRKRSFLCVQMIYRSVSLPRAANQGLQ